MSEIHTLKIIDWLEAKTIDGGVTDADEDEVMKKEIISRLKELEELKGRKR